MYSLAEIRALSEFARSRHCYLHMDGARLSNAAASLNLPFQDFTANAGVDLLSLGGTKNGLMGAECIVFFRPELADSFAFIRKQGLHLASKMRLALEKEFHFYIWNASLEECRLMCSFDTTAAEVDQFINLALELHSIQ